MDYVKKVGLAVLAMAALMAFSGAGSASATVLCKTNTEPCSEKYGVGTELKTTLETGTKMVLKAGFATVECSNSTITSKITNAGGATSTAKTKNETMTFGECNCEVKVLSSGETEWHWKTLSRNATLTELGTEVTVNCFGTDCVYGAAAGGTHEGTFTGLTTPVVHDTHPFPKKSGSIFCSSSAELAVTYMVTSPSPVFVTES